MVKARTALYCLPVGVAALALAGLAALDDAAAPGPRHPGPGITLPPGGGGARAEPPRPAARPPGLLAATLREKFSWTERAAAAVETLTEESWSRPDEEWAARYPRVIPLLGRLGSHPEVMPLVERRPECAMLLAAADRPDRLGRLLESMDDREYRVVEGWFKQYPLSADADLLLDVLEYHRTALLGLWDLNLLGGEKVFLFAREGPAEREYAAWLADVIDREVLRGEGLDEHRSSLFTFLECHGRVILARMKADPEFGRTFRGELWPRFVALAAPDCWDLYAALPGVWDILRMEGGVELVRKYFQLPVLLLASPEAYPKEFHDFILQALRNEDVPALLALELCRGDPNFWHLLRRPVTAESRRNVFVKLVNLSPGLADGGEAGESQDAKEEEASRARRKLLQQIAGWVESTVEKEYGGRADPLLVTLVPGYDVYALGDKLWDGRETSAEDWVRAGWDALDLAATIATFGASTPATSAGKAAGKTAGKVAGDLATDQARRALTRSAGGLTKGLTKEAMQSAADRYARRVLRQPASSAARTARVGSIIKAAREPLGQLARRPTAVDLTPAIKQLSTASGVGTRSAERLSRWNVSLIAREGGRLFAAVDTEDIARWGGTKLAETLAKQGVLRVVRSEVSPPDLDRAWRRNAHAWWMARAARAE